MIASSAPRGAPFSSRVRRRGRARRLQQVRLFRTKASERLRAVAMAARETPGAHSSRLYHEVSRAPELPRYLTVQGAVHEFPNELAEDRRLCRRRGAEFLADVGFERPADLLGDREVALLLPHEAREGDIERVETHLILLCRVRHGGVRPWCGLRLVIERAVIRSPSGPAPCWKSRSQGRQRRPGKTMRVVRQRGQGRLSIGSFW